MISRRNLLFFTALAACGGRREPLDQVLPERVSNWTRGPVGPVAEHPPALARAGVEEAGEAVYTGAGQVRIRIFRMRSEPGAFESLQQWRQSDGLATYKGRYFLLAAVDAGRDEAARTLLQAVRDQIR